jgi:hypothetical protein
LRAAGFAAAAVAFIAAASSPSLAVDLDGAPQAGFTAHESAQVEESDLSLNDSAPAGASAPKSGLLATPGTAAIVVRHAINWLGGERRVKDAIASAPARLEELVEAFAGEVPGDDQLDCLAKAVYFEARGEPIQGQLAVAQVVLNRAASGKYPATLCDVVTQKAQFSFIRDGEFPTPEFGSEAWRKAVAIARIANDRLARELDSDVLWYHADYVAPSWGTRLTRETKIGLHIFYS